MLGCPQHGGSGQGAPLASTVCGGCGHLLFSPPAKPRPLLWSRLHSSLWGLCPNTPHPEHLSELKLGLRPSGSTRHPRVP